MLNSEDLINKVKIYNKFFNPEKLNKAYNFAVKAHSNQKRASGDPYSVHPIEVANILTDLKLDSATITTGLLQDVSVLVESQSSNKVIVILYSVASPVPAFTFGKNNKLKNRIL